MFHQLLPREDARFVPEDLSLRNNEKITQYQFDDGFRAKFRQGFLCCLRSLCLGAMARMS
jgi:hypothetical protein